MSANEMEEFQELILAPVEALGPDQELGRGAYGRVYKVKYFATDCAAKETHFMLVDGVKKEEAQRTIELFLRECLRCSKLRHPNIVQFLGVYYPEGDAAKLRLPIMLMELMENNLTTFMDKNQNVLIETKFSIITDVACGLCYLHGQDPPIIHRDLSSNNVLLTIHNVAKIGDFGVSKVIRAGGKNTTAPGNADFMPPEALDSDAEYNTSLDVFSFAGIILHTLTQQWPRPSKPNIFDPKTRQLVALSEVERRSKYFDLMTEEGKVLRPLIEQCLDMDPAVRPSMTVVCDRLVFVGKDAHAESSSHTVSSLIKCYYGTLL